MLGHDALWCFIYPEGDQVDTERMEMIYQLGIHWEERIS